MSKRVRNRSILFGAGAICFIGFEIFMRIGGIPEAWIASGVLSCFCFVILALEQTAVNLKQKIFPDENILMLLAAAGCIYMERYEEGLAVLLFFQFGKLIEMIATNRTKKSIESLLDVRPMYANRKTRGEEIQVSPSELQVRNVIVVRPGERIPADAVVISGSTSVDRKALTGESRPVDIIPGDRIYCGSINLTGVI